MISLRCKDLTRSLAELVNIYPNHWRFIKIVHGGINIITLPSTWLFIKGSYDLNSILGYIYSQDEWKLTGYHITDEPPLCMKCNGRGRVDWINDIVGPKPLLSRMALMANLLSPKIIRHYNNRGEFCHCNTVPLISDGERVCKVCFGSGLFFDTIKHNKLSYQLSDGKTFSIL